MAVMLLILLVLFQVGVIGFQWVDNMDLRQQMQELREENYDLTTELDPVEIYNLREEREDARS